MKYEQRLGISGSYVDGEIRKGNGINDPTIVNWSMKYSPDQLKHAEDIWCLVGELTDIATKMGELNIK